MLRKISLNSHVVVGLPAHFLLQRLDHGDERAKVREEDHVAAEVVLKLGAEVRVAAPQQLGVLAYENALEDFEFAQLLLCLVAHNVPREAPVARVGSECRQKGHLLG